MRARRPFAPALERADPALVAVAFYADRAWGPPEAGSLPGWIALNVALYTVAAHCRRARAIAGAAIVAALMLPFEIGPLVEGVRVANVVAEWLLVGGVWLLGRWVRQRRRGIHALAQHAERLEADRDAR